MTDTIKIGRPMMKCGHSANATYKGKPCCAICMGTDPSATVIDKSPPSLERRKAQCNYCKLIRPSNPSLPFFKHLPNKKFDSFYCGCRGWD